MNRTMINLTIALMLVSSCALATGSRVSSLAGVSDYLADDSQVFAWPCRAPLYYRALVAELGTDGSRVSSNSSVAAFYADQERTFGVIGLAVNRAGGSQAAVADYLERTYTSGGVSVQANIIERLNQRGLGAGLRDIPAPAGGIEVMYARRFGDWTPGLRLGRSAAENTENITGSIGEATSAATGITVSASYEPRDALRADLSLEYAGYSFSSRFTLDAAGYEETFDADAARRLSAQARAFYSLNDEMVLVPRLTVVSTRLGYTYAQSDTGRDAAGVLSSTGLVIGAGWQYAPNPRYTLVAGLELGYSSEETTDSLIIGDPGDLTSSSKEWTVPAVHLGLETQLTRWLTARVGGSKRIASSETTTGYADGTSKTTKRSSDSYRLGCGVGIRIGGFLLDLTVDPELLYSGGNVLSGSKTWPVSQVSIMYRY